MIRRTAVALLFLLGAVHPQDASAQAKTFALTTTDGLQLHNAAAEVVTYKGKRGVRVTVAPEIARRPEYIAGQIEPEAYVRIGGLEFDRGVIEVELAGSPVAGAFTGARGFVGIAFSLEAKARVDGRQSYDAFYLRQIDGREDGDRTEKYFVSYISAPEWTWSRLRSEPTILGKLVFLLPGAWTKIRIDARCGQARLYVNDEFTYIAITRASFNGRAVALWIGPGTVAHFRNLVVTPSRSCVVNE